MSQKQIKFEKVLGELEALVEALEAGDLSLDESLKHFEKGIKLSRQCQETLNHAQQRVEHLMAASDKPSELNDDSDNT